MVGTGSFLTVKTKEFFMKKVLTAVMTFMLMMAALTPAFAQTTASVPAIEKATATKITATSAIAVDETTGQILYSKDANTVRPIASMSKIISAYLIMKSVKSGKMTWNQKVSINKSLEKVSENQELTNVPLLASNTYTVKNLFDASLIYSANAAILALGKAQAGTSEKFVDEMRQTVRNWGIKDAKLYNAAGLLENQVGSEKYPGTAGNVENAMSAKDMAIVIQHVLKEFPAILKVTSIQSAKFNTGSEKIEITNHNEMLKNADQYDSKYQIDGLKTGTSEKAGENFSATGLINHRRVISVVMGSKENQRFTDTKKVWNALMSKLTYKTTILKNQSSVKMNSAKNKNVQLQLATPVGYWVVKNDDSTPQLSGIKLKNKKLTAPVSKKKVIATGNLRLKHSQFLATDSNLKIKLKPTKNIQKANVFVQIGRFIASWFG